MSEPSQQEGAGIYAPPSAQPFHVLAPDGVTIIGGSYDNISAVQIACTIWHAYLDRAQTVEAPQVTVYDVAGAKTIAVINSQGGGLP